jgi:hypothetical protein
MRAPGTNKTALDIFVSKCYVSDKPVSLLLGALANVSKKETNDLVVSVRLSVSMEQLGSHWKGFPEILHLSIFRKSVGKIQVSLKSD